MPIRTNYKTQTMFKKDIYTTVIKTSTLAGLVVLSLSSLLSCDLDETQTVTTFTNLVAEDNFDLDGAPDPNLWSLEIGDGTEQGIPGWGNNELQFYTDRTENVKVENGFLLITAIQEPFNGAAYTSARLITKGKLETQYGRVEARMRLPLDKVCGRHFGC